jgi:hypothetical protein
LTAEFDRGESVQLLGSAQVEDARTQTDAAAARRLYLLHRHIDRRDS